jgi:hypothetical protein
MDSNGRPGSDAPEGIVLPLVAAALEDGSPSVEVSASNLPQMLVPLSCCGSTVPPSVIRSAAIGPGSAILPRSCATGTT